MIDHVLNLVAAIGGAFAIAGYLRRSAPYTPPSGEPSVHAPALLINEMNEVLRRDQDGNWEHVSSHSRHEGIGEELKHAGRTPGYAVRWFHGNIEEGRE